MYSCELVGRSETEEGIGLGFVHRMSDRRYHPRARSAKATIQGIPMRSFGLMSPIRAADLRPPPRLAVCDGSHSFENASAD
jgi:hypothetical protein